MKQHSETVMVSNYQNADCSLRKNIVSFIISFGTLSFPIELLEPAVSTVIGSRCFSHAPPSTWNKLTLEIRNSWSSASFKWNLKTYYFPVLSLKPASRHLFP